ncbi:MAG TPA: DUF2723 domain-containing protein, partial [Chitinophagaceae bacterium]
QQEWDDHDRHQKTLAPDLAKNYLESCAPNAVIFTFGDNDTYPLWYAQEVEGVRPDIRIINNSLLGIDWYVNQLRYKVNDADSLDLVWPAEKYMGNNRNYVLYRPRPNISQDTYFDLYDLMKNYIGSDDPAKMDNNGGEPINTFPITKVRIPVDQALVRKNGTANQSDSILSEFRFELPKRALLKNDLALLNIIAANQWKKPIYFTSPFGELGFGQFLRKEGMAYRLVPVVPKAPQNMWVTEQLLRRSPTVKDNDMTGMYNNMMTKFGFGGADKDGVYFDEENRRHLLNIRAMYGEMAGELGDAGRKDEAQKLLDKAEKGMNPANFPYALVSRYNSHNQTALVYLEAAYKAGKNDLAEKVRADVRKDLEQQQRYYEYMRAEKPDFFSHFERDDQNNRAMLGLLKAIEDRYAPQSAQPKPAGENPAVITPGKQNSDTPKKDTPR